VLEQVLGEREVDVGDVGRSRVVPEEADVEDAGLGFPLGPPQLRAVEVERLVGAG